MCYFYLITFIEQLMTLISAAKEHGIEFIYAISPGLDITFSNQKEVSTLKRKLDQVKIKLLTVSVYCTFICSLEMISCFTDSFYFYCRSLILDASPLLYSSMTLITTCVLQTKKCSAHSHMHKCLSLMRSTSIWENLKPFCFAPQVSPIFVYDSVCKLITVVAKILFVQVFCLVLFRILWNLLLPKRSPVTLPAYNW